MSENKSENVNKNTKGLFLLPSLLTAGLLLHLLVSLMNSCAEVATILRPPISLPLSCRAFSSIPLIADSSMETLMVRRLGFLYFFFQVFNNHVLYWFLIYNPEKKIKIIVITLFSKAIEKALL